MVFPPRIHRHPCHARGGSFTRVPTLCWHSHSKSPDHKLSRWSTHMVRILSTRSLLLWPQDVSGAILAFVVFFVWGKSGDPRHLRRRPPGGPVLASYCLRPHPKKTGASPDNRCRLVQRLQFGYNSRMRDFLEGRNSRNFLVELEGFEPSIS